YPTTWAYFAKHGVTAQAGSASRDGRPKPGKLLELVGEGWDHRRSAQDHRAINVPLAPVNDGQPRSLAGIRIPSSVALNCGDWTDSQADSAGSIPVTRSNVKIQVGRIFRRRLPVSSLFERAVRAINVQLATGADAPVVALAATNAGRLL